jgi:uncharacterized membrane protein HdeD (DUF308 family)
MSSPTVRQSADGPMVQTPANDDAMRSAMTGLWWMWLVTGTIWVIAALVVLQFDQASVKTVGVIVGCMFLFAGVQQLIVAFATDRLRWLWILFGLLFLASGIVSLVDPTRTFASLADILGFLFLTVGVWWTIEAFLSRDENSVWWLGLGSGILMIILAFWTSGQFFIDKAYVLLAFAGVWALLHGLTDIARAFMVRAVRDVV